LLPVVLLPLTSLLSLTIAIAIVACRHRRRCPSPSSSRFQHKIPIWNIMSSVEYLVHRRLCCPWRCRRE
jgi:hypothetical protein